MSGLAEPRVVLPLGREAVDEDQRGRRGETDRMVEVGGEGACGQGLGQRSPGQGREAGKTAVGEELCEERRGEPRGPARGQRGERENEGEAEPAEAAGDGATCSWLKPQAENTSKDALPQKHEESGRCWLALNICGTDCRRWAAP